MSKTPYRISFFGGGTDYPEWYMKNGGEVISTTIDKYIYISCRNLPPFFKHKFRVVYSKVEEVKNVNSIKHIVVKELLKKMKIKKGMEIHYDGDLPAMSGMGSSSSFVVGLVNAMYCHCKRKLNKNELAKISVNLERNILKETVGSQDQIAASFGGFNKIQFFPGGKFKVISLTSNNHYLNQLNKNLILIYTGIKRTANDVASKYVNQLSKNKKEKMNSILSLAKDAEYIIKNKQLDEFGYLLNESWELKKSLSKYISSNLLNSIYKKAMINGAIGGKILGAGGGGFFLFYVPKKNKERFLKCFNNYVTVPFKFNKNGSKIIFQQND